VEINNVVFSYDRRCPFIDGLNAVIEKGRVTVIIGPNGCGKSTLLSLLTRLRRPSGGSIVLDGREINSVRGRDYAKKVAGVYQINDGNAEITAEEFVAFGRTPYKGRFSPLSDGDRAIVERALRETGLADMRDKKLCDMSGGERQRVYIATALCQQPEVLFLDEPTSYLDMYYQLEVLNIVSRINRDGITVVMVLHDVNQALRCADNVIVMKDGAVVAAGDAKTTITPELLADVYRVRVDTLTGADGLPYYVPAEMMK